MFNCYLCGKDATKPLTLKDTFTGHNQAACPSSEHMCDRCYSVMEGREKLLWYWNEGKGKWSKLWGRSLSRLYKGNELISPVLGRDRTEGKDTLPVVSNLPTRAEMRQWIINPPEPPFTIAIAESGQKHILPWAQESQSQFFFSVQFELDSLFICRNEFIEVLEAYESLMAMGFSKTEINSGQYHSDRLMKNFSTCQEPDDLIQQYRGGRLLDLCSYAAILDASAPPTKEPPLPPPKAKIYEQVSLF